MNNNQYPVSHENRPATSEIVQFADGRTAFRFATPEDMLRVDPGSDHKYMRTLAMPGGLDRAVIRTRTGNSYGLGSGIVINTRTGSMHRVPLDLPPVTIGHAWVIPGVLSTSEVEGVALQYSAETPGTRDIQIPAPNPFPRLERMLDVAEQQLPHY